MSRNKYHNVVEKQKYPNGMGEDTIELQIAIDVSSSENGEGRKINLKEAGKKRGVSYCQAEGICQAFREKRMRGLIHGNQDRPSLLLLSDVLRGKVLEWSKEGHSDFIVINLVNSIYLQFSRDFYRK